MGVNLYCLCTNTLKEIPGSVTRSESRRSHRGFSTRNRSTIRSVLDFTNLGLERRRPAPPVFDLLFRSHSERIFEGEKGEVYFHTIRPVLGGTKWARYTLRFRQLKWSRRISCSTAILVSRVDAVHSIPAPWTNRHTSSRTMINKLIFSRSPRRSEQFIGIARAGICTDAAFEDRPREGKLW